MSCTENFQINMPLPETPDLVKHCDYLYERTAGCVGILSDWLSEAYIQALDEPKVTTVTLRHLEGNVPFSSNRAYKMLRRIANDEKDFLKEFSDEDGSLPYVKEDDGQGTKDASDGEEPLPKPKRRNSCVGERAPTRDENAIGKRDAA